MYANWLTNFNWGLLSNTITEKLGPYEIALLFSTDFLGGLMNQKACVINF